MQPWHKLYCRKAWYELRAKRLRHEPLCRNCKEHKIFTPATTVDHIKPHKGNTQLFFDFENTQSLCDNCHDSIKQKLEKRGEYGCDSDGIVKGWK